MQLAFLAVGCVCDMIVRLQVHTVSVGCSYQSCVPQAIDWLLLSCLSIFEQLMSCCGCVWAMWLPGFLPLLHVLQRLIVNMDGVRVAYDCIYVHGLHSGTLPFWLWAADASRDMHALARGAWSSDRS
jgi:hypothetical protein